MSITPLCRLLDRVAPKRIGSRLGRVVTVVCDFHPSQERLQASCLETVVATTHKVQMRVLRGEGSNLQASGSKVAPGSCGVARLEGFGLVSRGMGLAVVWSGEAG